MASLLKVMLPLSVILVFIVASRVIAAADSQNTVFPFTKTAGRCQGRYCGRITKDAECGACPRGYRPNEVSSLCVACDGRPSLYDWLYLAFMGLVSLILHWQFIALASNGRKTVILLQLAALFESVLAAVLTLVLTSPVGELTLTSCPVNQFSDWYTMFHNPTPDYEHTTYCTQEAVYPLYTIVLVYYTLSLVLMMLIRPLLGNFLDQHFCIA